MNTDTITAAMAGRNAKIKVIITGTTGMVGEGVLHECLQHPAVEEVLVINRKTGGVVHPKLKEVLHEDFFDLSAVKSQLAGYNACYFCLGTTSIGKSADEYYRLTYTLTLHFAETLAGVSPDLVFCYVSGAGTDTSEKGKSAWARVKGKTENELKQLPFRQEYNFRPGFIKPTKGLKRTHSFYKYINWFFPIGRTLYSAGFCTMKELGLAMISVTRKGYDKNIVDGKAIIALGDAEANHTGAQG